MTAPRRVLVPQHLDAQPPALGATRHTVTGERMGTTWSVQISGPRGLDVDRVRRGIDAVLDEVVAQMSPWQADSDISRYNRAPAGHWQPLPAAFRQVLHCALEVARVSDGAFDPTAGALVNLWGFGPPGPRRDAPQAEARHRATMRVGWRRLAWRENTLLQPGGLHLDLSGVAKGHAVDQVSCHLTAAGCSDHLVEIGGELRGAGLRPDGLPWFVDLQAPPGATALVPTRIALHGVSVATSGDYLRRYFDGTHERSHTLDPRRGEPITHGLASVSVVHKTCAWADAWSTALMVLGLEAGLALARSAGLAALLVQRTPEGGFSEHLSPAMEALAL